MHSERFSWSKELVVEGIADGTLTSYLETLTIKGTRVPKVNPQPGILQVCLTIASILPPVFSCISPKHTPGAPCKTRTACGSAVALVEEGI